ncbi:AAA family ATPase [Streptomyces sp. NPDC048644]|uniref:AAA family ATPase n=1 Tax=Streptomyces sp. NPDC048644 TaxID=3365582 RepID=UPI00371536B5
MSETVVHLMCGLNGAGKTAYARRLAEQLPAVRFGLDEWMLRLYPYRYDTAKYAEQAEVCKELIWETAVARAEARTAAGGPGAHPLDGTAVRHLASIFEPPTADEEIPTTVIDG